MSDSDYKKYFNFYSDYWALFKKYNTPPNKDSPELLRFWENLNKDSTELCEKYHDSRFVKEILLATLDEIDRISKGQIMES